MSDRKEILLGFQDTQNKINILFESLMAGLRECETDAETFAAANTFIITGRLWAIQAAMESVKKRLEVTENGDSNRHRDISSAGESGSDGGAAEKANAKVQNAKRDRRTLKKVGR
jgi:hypothetical protein